MSFDSCFHNGQFKAATQELDNRGRDLLYNKSSEMVGEAIALAEKIKQENGL